MKKKLSIILITLVLAVTMIVATACNDSGMIVKNEERNFTQVTAKVVYKDRAAQVDKIELNTTIYNFVYQYYSYYQQGYLSASSYQSVLDNLETSYEQANESLAQTEAYVLKCIDELYAEVQANGSAAAKAAADAAKTTNKEYNAAERIAELESVLPLKDLIAAREAYNEEMQETFDTFREEYEEEMRKATAVSKSTANVKSLTVTAPWKTTYEKGESLLENGLKVTAVYEDGSTVELDRTDYTVTGFSSDTIKEGVEVTVTFGSATEIFTVDIVAAKPSRPKLPTEEAEEEKAAPGLYAADDATKLPKLFEKDIEEQIEAARKASDKALYNALKEARFRLEKQMSSNYRTYEYYYLTKLKSQASTTYEEMLEDKAAVSDAEVLAEYAKKVEAQQQALTIGTTDYSDAVSGSSAKTQIVHEADGSTIYVWNLLLKITDDLEAKYTALEAKKTLSESALEAAHEKLIDQTRVYVSNVEYDKDAECEEEDCTCTACANYTGENPGPCTNAECTCEKCPNKRFITKDSAVATEKGLALAEDGSIGIKDALNAVYADLGTVGETDLEKAQMLEKFKTWIYMLNDDEGFFSTLTDGSLGYSPGNQLKGGSTTYMQHLRTLDTGRRFRWF